MVPLLLLKSAIMGEVSGLEATNTQDAIDELAYSIKSGESDTMAREVLAFTLTQLGVPTSSDSSFVTINENIMILAEEKYDEGNEDGVASAMVGDATVDNVLSGKTFTTKAGVGLTGAMVNQGAKTSSLNCGASYTIPAGYHNGSGKITANTLASQTSATATAADILSDKTAYVNGSKITGTMKQVEYQNGSGSYTSGGYATNNHTITFPKAFSKAPTVYIVRTGYTPNASDRTACNPNITGVTATSTTSFTFSIYNGSRDGSSVHVRWVAIVL